MSYSYSIAENIDISVCPVDGITIDFLKWTDKDGQCISEALTKKEALRLASAIIHAYKTGYVMNDDGGPIEPLTDIELQDIITNRFEPHGY